MLELLNTLGGTVFCPDLLIPESRGFNFLPFYATLCRLKADWGRIQDTDGTYSLEINSCLRLGTFGSDSCILKSFSVFFVCLFQHLNYTE